MTTIIVLSRGTDLVSFKVLAGLDFDGGNVLQALVMRAEGGTISVLNQQSSYFPWAWFLFPLLWRLQALKRRVDGGPISVLTHSAGGWLGRVYLLDFGAEVSCNTSSHHDSGQR